MPSFLIVICKGYSSAFWARSHSGVKDNRSRVKQMLETAPPRINFHPECSDLDCIIPSWEVLTFSWVLSLPFLAPLKSSSCSWSAYLANKRMMMESFHCCCDIFLLVMRINAFLPSTVPTSPPIHLTSFFVLLLHCLPCL